MLQDIKARMQRLFPDLTYPAPPWPRRRKRSGGRNRRPRRSACRRPRRAREPARPTRWRRSSRTTAARCSAPIAIRSAAKPVLLVSLPIDRVEPTPFQRDPSDPHVKRLMTVIETLDRFLDPLIVVRHDDRYWTPNGNHRLQAMRRLGAKAVVALLVPGSGGGVPDPGAQHREGAQPAREVARDHPNGARARGRSRASRRRRSRSSSSSRRFSRSAPPTSRGPA